MTKNYTCVPLIILILLIAALTGGRVSAQEKQKKVKTVEIKTDGKSHDATAKQENVLIKMSGFSDDEDLEFKMNIDSLIRLHCNGPIKNGDPNVQILKICNGDTVINYGWEDSLCSSYTEKFDSLPMMVFIEKIDSGFIHLNDTAFNFNSTTGFDSFLDPLNYIDIAIEDVDFKEYEGELDKNIEVMVNAGEHEGNNLIFITDDGERIKIEREGELVFINKEDGVKDIHSNIEVIENGNGDKVIVLQTRIVLDGLTKPEQKNLKSQGLKTSKKEPEYEYLKFYPNPSFDEFNVQFRLAEKADVEVKIANMLGKTIFLDRLENFEGEYRKALNLKPFGEGNYILQIIQGDRIISRKIIVE